MAWMYKEVLYDDKRWALAFTDEDGKLAWFSKSGKIQLFNSRFDAADYAKGYSDNLKPIRVYVKIEPVKGGA